MSKSVCFILSNCPYLGRKRFFLSAVVCVLFSTVSFAQKQAQPRVDSLTNELPQAKDDTNKVILLNGLSYSYNVINTDSGIICGEAALDLATRLGWKKGIAMSNSNLGINYLGKADYPSALDHCFKALTLNEELNDKPGVASNLGNIGLVYQNRSDYAKALEYYQKALKINEALNNEKGIAQNLGNISTIYEHKDDYDRALEYLLKALRINESLGNNKSIAINLGNIGNLYASQKKYAKALAYDFRALRIDQALGDKNGVAVNLGNIGETYYFIAQYTKGNIISDSLVPAGPYANLHKSVYYLNMSIAACRELGFLKGVIKFNKTLSKVYALSGNYKAALEAYMQYSNTKDSIFSTENNTRLKQIENQRDLALKNIDIRLKNKEIQLAKLSIDKKRNERVYFVIGMIGLVLVIIFIGRERKKSESLLLNILPGKIAQRLKKKEHPIADHFQNASIMFIDMAGFTQFSEDRDPKETVSILNEVFTLFDALAEKHGLEKIKTIGDCYMAVAGLPEPREDHAAATAAMALEIKDTMKGFAAKDGTEIHFRIGLDCGSVVAGVIGKKKFIYDLWGDAVNTASRMESTGKEGEIHCTDNFKNEVEAFPFERDSKISFTSRGWIEVKSKGHMKTWFIS